MVYRYVKRRKYKRRYAGKRSRFGKKKYTISRNKLRSKKIDSLLEKRVQEISRKETLKVIKPNYLTARGVWHDANGAWDLTTDVYPTLQNWLQCNETTFVVREISKLGGFLSTNISDPIAQIGFDKRSMNIRLKQIASCFHFCNEGLKTVVVDMQIYRFKYDKDTAFLMTQLPSAAPANIPAINQMALPRPSIKDHPPMTSAHTLTWNLRKTWKAPDVTQGNPVRSFSILARKRIYVPCGRMVEDPAGNNQIVNTLRFKHLKLVKTWKGLGRKEKYRIINGVGGPQAGDIRGSLQDGLFYFSLRFSGPVKLLGVTACTFCAAPNSFLDKQYTFDLGAAGAQ